MRLGRSVGRLDFWNIPRELSPHEIAVHQAAEVVEPWGDRRADLRMAVQTLNLLQVQAKDPFTASQREKIVDGLLGYLRLDRATSKKVTPESSAIAGQAAFAQIGK